MPTKLSERKILVVTLINQTGFLAQLPISFTS